jgi:hypothetical protein
LIWLARILTSSRVAAGSVESDRALLAETICPRNVAATGFPKRFKRASKVTSGAVLTDD